jgi:hypothetical protein
MVGYVQAGMTTPEGWDVGDGFELERFLAQRLTARLATSGADGPRVRPIWYLFEDDAFWWITGSWSNLERALERSAVVELVVDTCDLDTGEVLQVRARGEASVEPFDAELAQRWGARYLGPDRARWGRFATDVFEDPSSRFVRLAPSRLWARDLSWER